MSPPPPNPPEHPPATETTVTQGVAECIAALLHQRHPWMKAAAVKDAARRSAAVVEEAAREEYDSAPVPSRHTSRPRELTAYRDKLHQEATSFMSLPPELRCMVYEHIVIPEKNGDGGCPGSKAIYIGSSSSFADTEQDSRLVTSWKAQPAITKVSRQIRSEALPVFYERNRFDSMGDAFIHDSPPTPGATWFLDTTEARQWLESMGSDNRAMIKSFTFSCREFTSGPTTVRDR